MNAKANDVNRRGLLKRTAWIGMTAVSVFAMASTASADVLSLDGLWDFSMERDKSLEDVQMPAFVANDKMIVPGAWDATTRYYNQRGTGCYRRTFELERGVSNAFLVVDGFCLRSRYWIDGREVGFSKLPWSKVEFETGPLGAGRHEIVAAVDSVVDGKKVKLFRDRYDFYAFGGFHHGIRLETIDAPDEARRLAVRTRDYASGLVEVEVLYAIEGPEDFTANVSFDGGEAKPVEFRRRRAELRVPNPTLWSPDSPNLHVVSVETPQSKVSARFGIRQVGTANRRITLNGKPIYLKGANRHEAHFEFGSTTPRQLMYEDIQNVKDLGGNFIRGAHYAQCDDFLSLCDELGVMVWEESLGWGNDKGQFQDREFRDLQKEQTRIMVRNSINHPCIIINAFLNEPWSGVPECATLVDELIETIRAEDAGHLVTFACYNVADDISNTNTDIIAYNKYPGWYSHKMETGTTDELRRNIRECHEETVRTLRERYKDDRPIIIGETGVKADYGVHDPRGRAQYTEEFQDEYERLMLEEIFKMDEIAGVAIWQLTDAKTYTRVNGMINRSYGVNTGGLYDLYRRPKLVVETVRRLFKAKAACEDSQKQRGE